jgi:molecular chaperone DnaJ
LTIIMKMHYNGVATEAGKNYMAEKDYYSLLGVNRKASEKEIKQAFRRLARKHHPDVNPSDKAAENKFKEISQAYEVLSDKEKRKKYDQFGDQWQYADQFTKASGGQPPPFTDTDFSNIFGGGSRSYHYGSEGLDSLFDELLRGSRAGTYTSRAPRRGQDLEQQVEVTLEEAFNGTSRLLSLRAEEPCPTCSGNGRIQNVACSTCRGQGTTSRVKRLEVKIPAGVKTGSRVRVAGKGGQGHGGGVGGDLYLAIKVKPHHLFERRGDDLHVTVDVGLTTAMLGGEIQVPTLMGKLALKIPAETQNGRTFRLAGQGMLHLGKASRGDLKARVNVMLPDKLSAEEKELFKKLSQLRPE